MSPNVSKTTRIKVYELCKNNESLFQKFYDEIEKDANLFDNLAGALSVIEMSANLYRLARSKFRQLQIPSLNCKVYEAKSSSIRVYLFHEEKTGRIIVTGGKKDSQKEDIYLVKKIIKEYYESK